MINLISNLITKTKIIPYYICRKLYFEIVQTSEQTYFLFESIDILKFLTYNMHSKNRHWII
jgi:hypothetical protein